MKLPFDQGTPAPLRNHLPEHSVDTLAEKGRSDKDNGELLNLAEREAYDILATIDQSLRHQQNLAGREIGIVELHSANRPETRRRTREIGQAIATVTTRRGHRGAYSGWVAWRPTPANEASKV